MTLVSFFGFNEAVLAERYRASLYIKNDNTRMIVVKNPMTEPLSLSYAGPERISMIHNMQDE